MELNELIKELDKKLIVTGKEIIDGIMYIYCETERQITKCKYCGKESENVHSTYTRVISDLPIQNYKVKLIIKVKKYFCNNDKCQHTTFAEPLDFVERNAIRTKRLDNYINNIGLKTNSIEATLSSILCKFLKKFLNIKLYLLDVIFKMTSKNFYFNKIII